MTVVSSASVLLARSPASSVSESALVTVAVFCLIVLSGIDALAVWAMMKWALAPFAKSVARVQTTVLPPPATQLGSEPLVVNVKPLGRASTMLKPLDDDGPLLVTLR